MKKILEEIKEFDVDALERKGQDLNFEEVRDRIDYMIDGLKLLDEHYANWKLGDVQGNQERKLKEGANRLLATLRRLDTFQKNPRKGDAQDERIRIIQEFKNFFEPFFKEWSDKIDRYKTNSEIGDIKGVLDSEELVEQRKILAELTEKYRQGIGTEEAEQQSDKFEKSADDQKKSADKWLKLMWVMFGVLAIVLALLTIFLWSMSDKSWNDPEKMFIYATKIVVASFFSTLIYRITKNYNNKMHQHTINKHRSNALSVYGQFLDATGDPESRAFITRQAAKAIFETGRTGYLTKKGEKDLSALSGVNTIVENYKKQQ